MAFRTTPRADVGIGPNANDPDVPDLAPKQPGTPEPVVVASVVAPPAAPPGWRLGGGSATRARVDPDLPRSSLETAKRLSALPPGERAKELDQLQAKRTDVLGRIDRRVGVLDKKWGKMTPQAREFCLRDYAQRSKHLPPERRAEVMKHVDAAGVARARAARAEQRLQSLKAQGANPKDVAKAKTEVQAATAEQEKAVDAARQVVDGSGLKLDFLSLAEAAIDPEGFRLGSLLDLFDEFFEVSFTLSFFREEIDTMKDQLKSAQADDRRLDDINQQRDLEDRWRQGGDLKHRLLVQLGSRHEERRHRAGQVARGERRH